MRLEYASKDLQGSTCMPCSSRGCALWEVLFRALPLRLKEACYPRCVSWWPALGTITL